MSRYNQNEIQDSRNKIIKAASVLFRQKGYNGVGLIEIAESAGLTKGTFYAHFKSKRDLFNEIIILTANYRNQVFLSLKELPSEKKIHHLINWYLGDEHFKNENTGCLMPRLASDLKDHREEKHSESAMYISEFINYFKQCGMTTDRSELIASSLVGGLTMARALGGAKGLAMVKRLRIELLGLTNLFLENST